jgi:hypothetical protein
LRTHVTDGTFTANVTHYPLFTWCSRASIVADRPIFSNRPFAACGTHCADVASVAWFTWDPLHTLRTYIALCAFLTIVATMTRDTGGTLWACCADATIGTTRTHSSSDTHFASVACPSLLTGLPFDASW